MFEELTTAMAELEEEDVYRIVKELYSAGNDAPDILIALQKGMEEVGRRFEANEYFLSELIISGDIFKDAADLLGDAFNDDSKKIATIVIGTVAGDIHNVGKDIAISMLSCNGFKIIDLGIDVPAEQFIEAIKEHKPAVVGLSCLLTSCFDSMKSIIDAIVAAGLRDSAKIIIGGGVVAKNVSDYVGADAFTVNAQEAVGIVKELIA